MNMKQIIILTTRTMILVSLNSSANISQDNPIMLSTAEEEIVFAEYATATWCPQCPVASETLYDSYMNDNTPFYYVSLVRFIQVPYIQFYFDNYIDEVLVTNP